MTNPKLDRILIKDISFHKDGFLLLVKRGQEQGIPQGDFSLRVGEQVTIFGISGAIENTSLVFKEA
jgi:Trk K+ transport system NAD-binding subunit